MFKNNDSEEPVGENRRKMLSVNSISSSLSNRSEIVSQFQIQIGDLLVERLSAPELWNCKVLLVCAKNDQS